MDKYKKTQRVFEIMFLRNVRRNQKGKVQLATAN